MLATMPGFLSLSSSMRPGGLRSKHARKRSPLAILFAFLLVFSWAGAKSQVPVVVPGTTAVGHAAAAVNVTVTMSAAGVGGNTSAVTLGTTGMDFSTSATSCSGTYQVGSQCTVSVVFAPKYPGLRRGAVVVTSGNGQLLGSALVSGTATGALSVLTPGDIHTVA